MMPYTVELSHQAEADVREIYTYICEHGPAHPDDWKAGLDQKLASLETFPVACGFAPCHRGCRDGPYQPQINGVALVLRHLFAHIPSRIRNRVGGKSLLQ